ncbi:mitochondrial editing factor 22 [Actinidia rufa]|uniref:Mitochondrial editing factor 22 n=1 Tax=Actinidia rufa TaxID=165716 RepID=A0A7J0FUX7_9ERIC|nr:mitochondrial editing factor 22 [Actinidia rufa]
MVHDFTVANKLLYIYAQKHRSLADAYALFGVMREKNPVSWSVMVGGFVRIGDFVNCFGTFREYIRSAECPSNYTLPFVIRACRNTMDLKMGRLIHHIVYKLALHSDPFVVAALVDVYAKCRVIEDAKQLFDRMPKRDLVTWTVMIGGYAECGNARESLCGILDSAREIFDRMREENVIPWSAMIGAYGYHGKGRKAIDLFPLMLSSGILPNRITFVSLLYACSHAGRLDEALDLIENMSVEEDEELWGALLGVCRWEDVAKIRELMNHRRLKKIPSWTWIKVDNKTHQFSVGDHTHSRSKEIYKMLKTLLEKLELAGYVPDTNFVWHDVDEELKQGMLYSNSKKFAIAFGLSAPPREPLFGSQRIVEFAATVEHLLNMCSDYKPVDCCS